VNKHFGYTDIEQLRGIKIFYEDDFYEYAKVVIKIMDGYVMYQREKVNILEQLDRLFMD